MDINRAKEILSALAEGVDPTTGEVLSDDSVCNKGEVVRAFYAVLSHLDEKKSKKNLPTNTGKPWTKEDEELLVSLYRSGIHKREICKTMQRTESVIAARLVHLGVIADREIFRRSK